MGKLYSESRGQMRILEAVAASLIIFIVFSAATFINRSSDVKVSQERADLDRLGYNILSDMVESGTVEATLEKSYLPVELQAYLQRSLPMATFFNFTVYKNVADGKGWIIQVLFFNCSNVPSSTFTDTLEVSSTPVMYTSKGGNTYSLTLVLARVGGGD